MPQHKKVRRRRKKHKHVEMTIICKVDEEQIVTKIVPPSDTQSSQHSKDD